MIYLTDADILERIKAETLAVITEDAPISDGQEADAVNEVSSYLAHDYDITEVFKPVTTTGYALDSTIKRMTVDLLLYNLHNSKVNPRNIPENIVQKRDDAIAWLKDVANPRTNTNAPFLPKKEFEGQRNNEMAFGSRTKQKNDY
jgi:phage gp36-like protein